jgi:hypothetical protein
VIARNANESVVAPVMGSGGVWGMESGGSVGAFSRDLASVAGDVFT